MADNHERIPDLDVDNQIQTLLGEKFTATPERRTQIEEELKKLRNTEGAVRNAVRQREDVGLT